MSTTRILDWRPVVKGSLRGFANVQFPSGTILLDVRLMHTRDWWVAPPSRPMIGRDGTVLRDANGNILYSEIIEFASKEIRNRWSAAIVDALRAAHPEVFEDA
jgi:hypothetical protein